MNDLGPIDLKRRKGDEPFHVDGQAVGFDFLSFWQWSSSNVEKPVYLQSGLIESINQLTIPSCAKTRPF